MTITKISNDQLQLEISVFGAELHSVKKDEIEYLWQGDADFWGRQAPVLFPIVGKFKNGKYLHNGEEYALTGHGFARDKRFELIDSSDDELVYELIADKETLQVYPFDFRLRIRYKLVGNQLLVKWQVKNQGSGEMLFGIGAHPAFNVPLKNGTFEDYQLTINPEKSRTFVPLDAETGMLFLSKKYSRSENEFNLSRELFKSDALIFETPGQTEVLLSNTVDDRSVKVSWEDMPFVGLWSPYPKEAPFVCIEPWCGIADDTNTDGDLATKFGINSLGAKQKFSASYTITIN